MSPTFAAAKGIGPWDIQSTIGANLPATGADLLGRTTIFNTAVDYKIKGKIWPMLEQNSTFWSGGALDGKKEVFLTPGVVLGSFPLAERLHVSFGGGVQIAATQFHQYNHRWMDSFSSLPVLISLYVSASAYCQCVERLTRRARRERTIPHDQRT